MFLKKWGTIGATGILATLLCLTACNKEDKKGEDVTDKLKNKYCNIPGAINYNWNFPGIEDNSICYFATDYYEGTWKLTDSVRLEDSTFVRVDTLYLEFNKIGSDTTNSKMHLRRWCITSDIWVQVNKYYIGMTDTTQNAEGWQLVCNGRDSLKINFSRNVFDSTIVDFTIRQFNNDTMYYHQATGVKL